MSQPLPRYRTDELAPSTRQHSNQPRTTDTPIPTGKAGGDKRQLRGIPVVGACSGTSPGTDPYHALK